MKTVEKGFLWFGCFGIFAAIGIYIAALGGIFYYNLQKWTFDEKLKNDSIEMVHSHILILANGLDRNQSAISMAELTVITTIAKHEHVASLLYLNKYGEIRWFKDSSKITMSFDEFRKEFPRPTNAIEKAWLSKMTQFRVVPDMPLYDIAIPLAVQGDVLGLVNMQISREDASKEIDKAMRKFSIGVAGVLLLLGILLHFILRYFVNKSEAGAPSAPPT